MPPVLSYPSVYIEELPSGVHTITGVATSIGAFVGWAPQGSTTEAVLVQSFMDYQREFGGLDSRSNLCYAVNHFFNNGGQQAYIVRLVSPPITTGIPTAGSATINVTGGQLTFTANNADAWANAYGIQISSVSASTGAFILSFVYAPSGTALVAPETNTGVTVASIGSVTSNYVTIGVTGTPSAPPANGIYMLGGGTDVGATDASVTLFSPTSTTDGFAFTAQNPGAWEKICWQSRQPRRPAILPTLGSA